jgi:DNA polymerase-3 subunit alpha
MSFVTLEDLTGSLEVVVFPSVYEKHHVYLQEKEIVVVTGKKNGDKILADRILSPDEAEREAHSGVHVLLTNPVNEEKLIRLRDLFIKYRGKCSIFIHTPELESSNRAIRASSFLLVEPNDVLLSQLREEKLVEKAWVT